MKNLSFKILRISTIVLAGLAAAAAAAFLLWKDGRLIRLFSPWTVWTAEKQTECTVNSVSGRYAYRIGLDHRRVRVYAVPAEEESPTGSDEFTEFPAAPSWESPEKLRVQDYLWSDIDSDGMQELMLLCWYIREPGLLDNGQPVIFGKQWTQHIYIYKPDGMGMHEHWLASKIMMNVSDWDFDERQRLFLYDENGTPTRWDWFGWGIKYFADGYPEVRVMVTGDNLIHQKILEEGREKGNFDFLYEHISDRIKGADLAILGQETVFVGDGIKYSGYPYFCTPLAVGEAALWAGFSAAACASNHALDAGTEGINSTAAFYEERGVPYFGIVPEWERKAPVETGGPESLKEEGRCGGSGRIISIHNLRIAVLNYTYGTNVDWLQSTWPGIVSLLDDEERIRAEIQEAKEAADAVIVCVHWGTEYAEEPDEFQKHWTEVFLECGVDAVVGGHPHVLQPMEMLTARDGHQMLLYNSLGNLVSRQDQAARVLGGLADFTIQWTPEGIRFPEYKLEAVVTHQTKEHTAVWLLDDYSEELAAEHRLGLTRKQLDELFEEVRE